MASPPFIGTIEFVLSIRAFDERTARKARVGYAYTPHWTYFHVLSRTEKTDDQRLDLGLALLALPRAGRSRIGLPPAGKAYWLPVSQLLTVGVLRPKVFELLRTRIDIEAQEVDRCNRISAGLTVPPATEYL
ncbi:hypothetical protein [Reyranella sp.]|jgi:hypothetical protein|uniref:hypothetical protein n=1 Tax=Reyranella sp. TaxID=1929291 RepID=UPI004035DCF8